MVVDGMCRRDEVRELVRAKMGLKCSGIWYHSRIQKLTWRNLTKGSGSKVRFP